MAAEEVHQLRRSDRSIAERKGKDIYITLPLTLQTVGNYLIERFCI